MRVFRSIWGYFKQTQPPAVRVLHAVILILVICQLVSSNFIEFDKAGRIVATPVHFIGTWTHIATGLTLVPITLVFVIVELLRRGLFDFFPYLQGDFAQVRSDLAALKQRRLPEASPRGLAAIVQGLGLGAVLITLLAGLTWFVLWRYGVPWAGTVRAIHATLTGLVEAYIVGHGGMGLLHIFFWNREQHRP